MASRKKFSDLEIEKILNDFSEDDSFQDPDNNFSDDNDGENGASSCDDAADADEDDNVLEEDCTTEAADTNELWSNNVSKLHRFPFTGIEGLKKYIPGTGSSNDLRPIDVFLSFCNQDVFELIVEETNRYAHQMISKRALTRSSRMNRWKDTDTMEIKKFFGIVMFMGLVHFPRIEYYWKKDSIYFHPLIHNINMSYNRFTTLLRCWHFTDNEIPGMATDRLFKVQPLIDVIMKNVNEIYSPGEVVVVDETMIPFRGRLHFRQYNPSKSSRYGVKIYKLCTPTGFVCSFRIYCGQDPIIAGLDKSGSVVVSLGRDLLNEGRIFIIDNWYTSLPLANYLRKKRTDVCGTLRKNRKNLPQAVVNAKLKHGEIIARQANNITVLKWHDKRDVLMMSTFHDSEMVDTGKTDRQRNTVLKPTAVLDYNKWKQGIDVSDQMSTYYSPLRKSLIWYKKVAIELIFGSIVVNSQLLFNNITSQKLSLLQFTQELVRSLLDLPNELPNPTTPISNNIHFLEKIPRKEDNKIVRKRCTECYKGLKNTAGTSTASRKTKQVDTECKICEKAFCIPCFAATHTR